MKPLTVSVDKLPRKFHVKVVGCGGTGGFVAEGLCRLPVMKDIPIILIDYDRVEEHNLLRQNFFQGDVGKFKSLALAERLARSYGRELVYSVLPFDGNLRTTHGIFPGHYSSIGSGVIIGCVDPGPGRLEIAKAILPSGWWIDSGNLEQSGQVLIGNATKDALRNAIGKKAVTLLPMPSVQQPELLTVLPEEKPSMDCAEAVNQGGQSPVINQVMASLVLEYVNRLFSGTLKTMGTYIDMDAGTMSTVPVTPDNIARAAGLKVTEVLK